jgi:hypothetical protein
MNLKDFSSNLLDTIKEENEKPKQYIRETAAKMGKFQEQIKKQFEHQEVENEKMQKDITDLKGDKTSISQDLIGKLRITQHTLNG